jgi:hypothetical protein
MLLLHHPELCHRMGRRRAINERVAVGTEQHQIRHRADLRPRQSSCLSARTTRTKGDDVGSFRKITLSEREAVAEQILVVISELTSAARPHGEQDARHLCDLT